MELYGANGLGVVRGESVIGPHAEPGFADALRKYAGSEPVFVRFFDSPAAGWGTPEDQNSGNYLGYRGVRLLELDAGLLTSFSAALQARLDRFVVVLPMVTSAAEVRRAREALGAEIPVGVTVETPSAALCIDDILDVAEYVQIGLNDLTQYTMAWDRDLPHSERLPPDRIVTPVGALIEKVVRSCDKRMVPYTLGLDLRPTYQLSRQLRSLGVSSISCTPPLIPRWQYVLR
jgi:phosphoenolpyruvate-protein kinase (PTS system EI component)